MANVATYVLLFICVFIMPAIILYVGNKPVEVLSSESFKKKFGKVYEDLKVRQIPAIFVSMVYLGRRFLFVWIMFSTFLIKHVSL